MVRRGDFSVDLSLANINSDAPLQKLWQAQVAAGYAGLVISKAVLISHSRGGETEIVSACNAGTGKELWRNQYRAPVPDFMLMRYGPGPHSTPCIAAGKVATIGGTGILNVYDLQTGKQLWTRDIWQQYDATKLERGYSASPIAFRGMLILPVGGQGSGIVAFDLNSGKEVWKSTDFQAAYSSPILTTLASRPQLICLMEQDLVALDPNNGKQLWSYEYQPTNTVHVASPIALPGDRLFFLSSNLATMLKITEAEQDRFEIKKQWESRRMTFQVGNVISVQGQLIGPSSTSSAALLTALREKDGQQLWKNRISGTGFVYRTLDGFITISDKGRVAFNQIVDEEIETLAVHPGKFAGRVWNAAAFDNDVIYIRDETSIGAYQLNRQK